jgi:hypothetical protein
MNTHCSEVDIWIYGKGSNIRMERAEGFHNFHPSYDSVRVNKWRIMKILGHAKPMEKCYCILFRNP